MTLIIEVQRIGRFSWVWRAGTMEGMDAYFTRQGAINAAKRAVRRSSYRTPWRPA